MEKQLTALELARRMNISLRTLESRIREGRAPPFYWIGRIRRWNPPVVRDWIATQTLEDGGMKQLIRPPNQNG